MTITKLPAVWERIETGALQFGDDWPGVFIRGDDALGLIQGIEFAQRRLPGTAYIEDAALKSVIHLLQSCRVKTR